MERLTQALYAERLASWQAWWGPALESPGRPCVPLPHKRNKVRPLHAREKRTHRKRERQKLRGELAQETSLHARRALAQEWLQRQEVQGALQGEVRRLAILARAR